MSSVFNIAKGKVRYYCELPGVSDALVLVPLSTAEFEADLVDHTTLSEVLLAASVEQTVAGRKVLSDVSVSTDLGTNTISANAGADTYVTPTGNAIVTWLICYVPNINAPDDTTTVPLVSFDTLFTPDGNTVNFVFPDTGFWTNA